MTEGPITFTADTASDPVGDACRALASYPYSRTQLLRVPTGMGRVLIADGSASIVRLAIWQMEPMTAEAYAKHEPEEFHQEAEIVLHGKAVAALRDFLASL